MTRHEIDELGMLRAHAATLPFVPVWPWEHVTKELPPVDAAPIAHPLYTLRLALRSTERVCQLAGIKEWQFLKYIDGTDHPDAETLARLAVGCLQLGARDHAHWFLRCLGVVLVQCSELDYPNKVMYGMLTAWAYDVGPELPGNALEAFREYSQGVFKAFWMALDLQRGEAADGRDKQNAGVLLAALREPDDAYVGMVAGCLGRGEGEGGKEQQPGALVEQTPVRSKLPPRLSPAVVMTLVGGALAARLAHRRGRPPGAKNKVKGVAAPVAEFTDDDWLIK